mgnify:FL=1
MTHTEQIQTWKYASVDDGFAGQTPITPILQTLAPTWATINQISGNDIRISLRLDTESTFEAFTNYRSDFRFQRNMFITTRFGNLDITGIKETGRKRGNTLELKLIEGVTETSGGNIMTVYKTTSYGDTSVNVGELAGNTILLGFREGIQKKVVESSPELNQLGVDIDGNVSLVEGDIFADELLTFLYQTV